MTQSARLQPLLERREVPYQQCGTVFALGPGSGAARLARIAAGEG